MMFCMNEITPLVSAVWLLENLEKVVLVDVRFALGKPDFGLESYRAGHLPGAVFLDLERDLSSPVRNDRVGGRHPLPDPQTLATKISSMGIDDSSFVVAYDDPSSGQGFYAAHLWWLMRWLGHDEVAVLDGGLPAWLEAGGKLEVTEPQPQAPHLLQKFVRKWSWMRLRWLPEARAWHCWILEPQRVTEARLSRSIGRRGIFQAR